jgi:hypothetical protein
LPAATFCQCPDGGKGMSIPLRIPETVSGGSESSRPSIVIGLAQAISYSSERLKLDFSVYDM